MNWNSIKAIVLKDVILYFRNRLFSVITILGLVMFALIYFLMPSSVDETLKVGFYAPGIPSEFIQSEQIEEGVEITAVDTEEELKEQVTEGKYVAGLALAGDWMGSFDPDDPINLKVYLTSDLPDEMKDIIQSLITEMAYEITGQPSIVEWQPEILGRDMVGEQIPQRDRMRSLFAVLILMTETFALAGLLCEEFEKRTAQALLVTPLTIKDLFTAKAILGILMAFTQALLIVVVIGGMNVQPAIIALAIFLGSVLVTAIAFLMAAMGKDLISVMAWGVPAMVILIIPAFAIMSPGAISDWVKVIPSYYLTDTVYQTSNLSAGWGDIWSNLVILFGFNVVLLGAGILALRRKLQWA